MIEVPDTFAIDRKKIQRKLSKFQQYFKGEIHWDDTTLALYSYDASVYRIKPLAVLYPRTNIDLKNIVLFCRNNSAPMIPRTAGTSLGGQCVGEALIVDVSKYLNNIIEVNEKEKYAIVQPGVVRDELNIYLKKHNLFFGPNTSTSNRAMIGGMVGNNSSGTYSIKYGTTRENTISIRGYLADGSEAEFGEVKAENFKEKTHGSSMESAIYRHLSFELSHPLNQEEIEKKYPKKSIKRRNTGYALDELMDCDVFKKSDKNFNLSKLLCGSEGTLMLFSEIKIKLVDRPTDNKSLICAHFESLSKSLKAVPEIMKFSPNQCELMDKAILDCTKDNILQRKNRFFIKGDPEAILMIEVEGNDENELKQNIEQLKSALNAPEYAYDFSVLYGEDIGKAMQLRASGLGVLQNIVGDNRSTEFVEDTAVDIEDLADYIEEFEQMVQSYDTRSIYYAHAGAGEIHIRPLVNLKSEDGRKKFRKIGEASARLVAKYRGSLSGEHGDGIVRSEFIPEVLGERNYELIKRIKKTWDPQNIFNPGKISDPIQMDDNLQLEYDSAKEIDTQFSFSKEGGFINALEKCSGSADCRKTEVIGGSMCPSFHASRNEGLTTRGRANALKEFFTHSHSKNLYENEELHEIMKLCLGCKACISECPSSVDMAAIKSEFLHQYYSEHKRPKFDTMVEKFDSTNEKLSKIAPLSNLGMSLPIVSTLSKKILGIDARRSLPKYKPLNLKKLNLNNSHADKVYLYIDEFSRFYDADIVYDLIGLFEALNISITILPMLDSSRSAISRGMLDIAKKQVNNLVSEWSKYADDDFKIIGIEPSAILGLRDDYFRLVEDGKKEILEKLSKKTMLVEEYLSELFESNPELSNLFVSDSKDIIYHGHCHQKSLSSSDYAISILNFPKNYTATEINSGCCGMAGSFGYENYEMSMKVGNLRLFPAVKNRKDRTIISASGTSCRHQIKDGTNEKSIHPVQVLKKALRV